MTNVEKLQKKFAELKAKGQIRDLKVWGPNLVGASLEDLSGEMLEILEAFEQGDFVPIPDDKLK